MKKFCLLVCLLVCWAILNTQTKTDMPGKDILTASYNFEKVTLYGDSTSDEGKVVITIVGDGYTLAEMGPTPGEEPLYDYTFMGRAQSMANTTTGNNPKGSFNGYPYTLFLNKNKLNVHVIKVVSAESGIGDSEPKNTFFGVHNAYSGSNVIYPSNEGKEKLKDLLAQYAPTTSTTFVLANGSGGDCAVPAERTACIQGGQGTSTGSAIHELGHAIANLADEDDRPGGMLERPNLSKDNNPNTVRWKNFIGINDIGIVSYPTHRPGWYSSGASCIMNTIKSGRSYCDVCAAAIIEQMADEVNEPFYGTLYNGISSQGPFVSKPLNTETSIDFPSGHGRILDYAFHGCNKLQNLTIPADVKTIGKYAFLKCTGLTGITNNAVTPQAINADNVFFGVDRSNIALLVPAGTEAAYEAAGWRGFKTINGQSNVVEMLHATSLQIYPNPFADALHIADAEGCIMRMTNMNSVVVCTQKLNSNDEIVRLQHLLPGVYVLSLEKTGQIKAVKMVKK